MVNVNKIFTSDYLRADELNDKPHLVTISGTEVVTMQDGTNKILVRFVEFDKGLLLNKTNASNLTEYLGPETDNWHGQHTVMFPTYVDFQGKSVEAIRVRKPKPQAAAQSAPGLKTAIVEASKVPVGRFADEELNDAPF